MFEREPSNDELIVSMLLYCVGTTLTLLVAFALYRSSERTWLQKPDLPSGQGSGWLRLFGRIVLTAGCFIECIVAALAVDIAFQIFHSLPWLSAGIALVITAALLILLVESAWFFLTPVERPAWLNRWHGAMTGFVRTQWVAAILLGAGATAFVIYAMKTIEGHVPTGSTLDIAYGAAWGCLLVGQGLIFLRSAHWPELAPGERSVREHQVLKWSLRGLAVAYLLLGVSPVFWFIIEGLSVASMPMAPVAQSIWLFPVGALALLVLAYVFGVATMGGRRKAIHLQALWSLTNWIVSRRPLDSRLTDLSLPRKRKLMQTLLTGILSDAQSGRPWSQIIFERRLASRTSWLELKAAEHAGSLEPALQQIARRETARFAQSSDPATPRIALGYFAGVVGLLLLMMAYLGMAIVPRLARIHQDFGAGMPDLTAAAFSILNMASVQIGLLLGAIGCLVIALVGEGIVNYLGWWSTMDMIAGLARQPRDIPGLLRALRWGVLAKRPLGEVLDAMSEVPLRFAARSALQQAAIAVREGYDTWETLGRTHRLSTAEIEVLQAAQAAGNLPWALETLSESRDATFDYRMKWWLQILHPLVIIALGLAVGTLALAFLLPLFQMIGAYA